MTRAAPGAPYPRRTQSHASEAPRPDDATRPLAADTWPAYARLIEANGGVWGGCWCLWYHGREEADAAPERKHALKEGRVREGRAHTALVFSGESCVGWCQFGPPAELPRIHNARAYAKEAEAPPDWRITCFFSGKGHRGAGVAAAALAGALDRIRAQGGGRVEGYPEDVAGRTASPAFLSNGALSLFEREGFARAPAGQAQGVVTLDA